jgi:hypothetical protein
VSEGIIKHCSKMLGILLSHSQCSIPASIEVLCKSCSASCNSLQSLTFKVRSKLQRIEESALSSGGVQNIIIPTSVEMLCTSCFTSCYSRKSLTFET